METSKILVVENDGFVTLNLHQRLANLGYSGVTTASTGEEAIQKAMAMPPDLLLMDLQLQGSPDGVETVCRIREKAPDIPVVYLTGSADEKILERAKITQPAGYLFQSFGNDELSATIGLSLENSGKSPSKRAEYALSEGMSGLARNPESDLLTGYFHEEGVDSTFDPLLEIRQKPGLATGRNRKTLVPEHEAAPADAEMGDRPTGKETILLVEDDETVRTMVARILEMGGYAVLEAVDVDAAQQICRHHVGDIQLLLTDMQMPGMNGMDLAGALLPMRPTLKVLCMSGRSADEILPGMIPPKNLGFLQKPFRSNDLQKAVRGLLGDGR